MPAGTDLITWSPRVGATGNDRYDVPAGEVITAGTSSYSDPPTLTEVNAGSGINQVVAEYQRRRALTNQMPVYGGDISGFSYISSGSRINSADCTNMRTNIDTLRRREQGSSYGAWSNVPANGITGVLLSDLRKALATDSFRIPVNEADHLVSGTTLNHGLSLTSGSYPPSGTPTLRSDAYDFSTSVRPAVGQAYNASLYWKYRSWLYFAIPSDAPTFGAGVMSVFIDSVAHPQDWIFRLYRSNTHLAPMDTGDWASGFNNLEYGIAASSISENAYLEMDVTASALSAGQDYTFCFRSKADEDDSPEPTSSQFLLYTLVQKGDIGGGTRRYCPLLILYTA